MFRFPGPLFGSYCSTFLSWCLRLLCSSFRVSRSAVARVRRTVVTSVGCERQEELVRSRVKVTELVGLVVNVSDSYAHEITMPKFLGFTCSLGTLHTNVLVLLLLRICTCSEMSGTDHHVRGVPEPRHRDQLPGPNGRVPRHRMGHSGQSKPIG